MISRPLKLAARLSAFAMISAIFLVGCDRNRGANGSPSDTDQTSASERSEGLDEDSSASGAANGAGENSKRSGDPATDDVAYLKLLGLARGHLAAFYELYQGGFKDMAATHVKHADSELYVQMGDAFRARNLPGFADKLEALADAAAAGDDIDEDYSAVITELAAHAPRASAGDSLLAISEIIRMAGDAFEAGVEDNGAVSNATDYQEAYGFLIASRDILSVIDTDDVNETDAIGFAHEQIEAALASFDGLTAETTEGRAETLYDAGALIESAARRLV